MKKVQLPVVGGIRKTIVIPDANLATALSGFEGKTLTLAQLRTLLGVAPITNTGNGNIGPPGQGTPPKVNPQIIQFMFGDDGGGGDSGSGPPGQQGAPGTNGATGSAGPAGPAVFMIAEPGEDAWPAVPGNPGPAGANGTSGGPGPAGPAVMFFAEDGQEGDAGPPGATGPAGASGGNTFSGVSVRQSVDQALPGSAVSTLGFDTTNYDTSSYHSNVTNNSRLTAPITGYYLVTANMRQGSTTVTLYPIIAVNGATIAVDSQGATFAAGSSTTWEGHLTAGDYVEFQVFAVSASNSDHTATTFTMSLRGT